MARPVPRVNRHAAARLDLVEIGDYLARKASLAVSERFLDEAEQTLARLSRRPKLGALWESDAPGCDDIRYLPLSRFRHYLIFYRPIDGGIEVLRVLHGARDIRQVLEPDAADEE